MRSLLVLAVCGCALAKPPPKDKPRFYHTYTLPARSDRTWSEFDERGLTDPFSELTEVTMKIGPFGPIPACAPGTDTQRCPSSDWQPKIDRPELGKTIEIAFWGDWKLVDEKGDEIPRPDLYLHHILAYIGGNFITGCSSERTTWGPDHLPYPYRQVLGPNDVPTANGFHYNNLSPRPITFWVQYKMLYKVHVPTDPAIRVVESQYWMDNYNVPGDGGRDVNATHVRPKAVTFPRDGVVVSMNGHLHQGGISLAVVNAETGATLCEARNVYNQEVQCYWDCPDVCSGGATGWTAQWATTTCFLEEPVHKETAYKSVSTYDNTCAWRGVMAWWFNFVWYGQTMGGEKA